MNFDELNDYLEAKISELEAAKKDTYDMRRTPRLMAERLERVHEDNVFEIKKLMINRTEESPESIKAFFESMPDSVRETSKPILDAIESAILKQKAAVNTLPTLEDRERLEKRVQKADARLEGHEREIKRTEEKHFRLNSSYVLQTLAENFKYSVERGSPKKPFDFQAFKDRKPWVRKLMAFFETNQSKLHKQHELYCEVLNKYKAIKKSIDGDADNPLDFLESQKDTKKALHVLAIKQDYLKRKLHQRIGELEEREELESRASDKFVALALYNSIGEVIGQNHECFMALGKHLKSKMYTHLDGEPEPFDGHKAATVLAKSEGLRAITQHHDRVIAQLDKALKPLKDAHEKLAPKLGKIGHKDVGHFESSEDITRAVAREINRAEKSNDWFRKNNRNLESGQCAGISDAILMWTAVYFVFTGDEVAPVDAATYGEDITNAVHAFEASLNENLSVGDALSSLDSEFADLGSGSMLSVVSNLKDLEINMGSLDDTLSGMDDVSSSMDSMTSSMDSITSSMDSITSSMSYSSGFGGSSDFGGGGGGGF